MSENSETKWTAGEWEAHPASSVTGALISYGDISKGENVAFVVAQRNKAETEANAHLMAASKKLYKALAPIASIVEECQIYWKKWEDESKFGVYLTAPQMHAILAALKSARGER